VPPYTAALTAHFVNKPCVTASGKPAKEHEGVRAIQQPCFCLATPNVYVACMKKKCTVMSFNCGLSYVKISASVTVSEK